MARSLSMREASKLAHKLYSCQKQLYRCLRDSDVRVVHIAPLSPIKGLIGESNYIIPLKKRRPQLITSTLNQRPEISYANLSLAAENFFRLPIWGFDAQVPIKDWSSIARSSDVLKTRLYKVSWANESEISCKTPPNCCPWKMWHYS